MIYAIRAWLRKDPNTFHNHFQLNDRQSVYIEAGVMELTEAKVYDSCEYKYTRKIKHDDIEYIHMFPDHIDIYCTTGILSITIYRHAFVLCR